MYKLVQGIAPGFTYLDDYTIRKWLKSNVSSNNKSPGFWSLITSKTSLWNKTELYHQGFRKRILGVLRCLRLCESTPLSCFYYFHWLFPPKSTPHPRFGYYEKTNSWKCLFLGFVGHFTSGSARWGSNEAFLKVRDAFEVLSKPSTRVPWWWIVCWRVLRTSNFRRGVFKGFHRKGCDVDVIFLDTAWSKWLSVQDVES